MTDRSARRRTTRVVLIAGIALLLASAGCGGADEAAGPIVYQGLDGLVVVQADGSEPRPALPGRFGTDARHADWSPDGGSLAFTFDEADGTRDLWLADADGSNARRLVDCIAPCRDADSPAWSSDGERIAFTRIVVVDGVDQGATVELVDPETGAVERVASTTTEAEAGAPRWSSDGGRLVVELLRWASSSAEESERTGSAIGVIDLDAEPTVVRPITDFALHASYPDWHPSDDLIVFQAGDGDPFAQQGAPQDLYTVRPDGTGLTRLTRRTPSDPWLALPAWLAGGDGILVTVIRGAGDFAFQALAQDGTDPVDLVDPATGERLVGAHARQAAHSPT